METLIRSVRLSKHPLVLSRLPKKGEINPAESTLEDVQVSVENQSQYNLNESCLITSEINRDVMDKPFAVELDKEREIQMERERYAQEIEIEKEHAKEAGYREGYELGNTAAQAEHAASINSLRTLFASASQSLTEGIEGAEDAIVEITFEAICKVIGGNLVDKDGVIAVVREVINHAKERENLAIRVSPDDFSLLSEHRARLLSGIEESTAELIADDRVILGGCLLEAPGGNLDGRLEIQLQQLRDALLSARSKRNTLSHGE